ncbi:acetyl-CoA carboxylase biotin carboxyl carrier protein subunit [Tamlana sp. 2201CG12-4]|uniref:acetyl-CoA carboxylase biotin carboxyl carrier protein subunit n=1 Tax=Tamlana sp. 2201CG12-4 TaxID=3112582 RepID=UPI002DBC23C7|nr:acetyl-CoA carboxylase biotin carboxyl carrier protein subunit [Tamlana sp. 2201CG12-4]MEC3908567.1 acetyl-CoA carboxylase biotin carboxyl carrier protein subunit [Tamlana sp. 2201CG12-4]
MSKDFKVKVNDTFNFEITNHELKKLDILRVSDSSYHILQDNKSFNVEIEDSNFNNKSYQIKVNGNVFQVSIFNELDTLINTMGFTVGTTKQIDFIKAPMPGLILEINVQAKQVVMENEPLLILEAMKMENVITSPREGVVKSITVNKGDAVEKNQLLIEFE